MALQLGALRNALLEAGASAAAADRAAEELAGYNREFESVRGDIAGLRASVSSDIAELRSSVAADIVELRSSVTADIVELRSSVTADIVEVRADVTQLRSDMALRFGSVDADIKMLKWAQGVTFAGVLAVLLKLFIH